MAKKRRAAPEPPPTQAPPLPASQPRRPEPRGAACGSQEALLLALAIALGLWVMRGPGAARRHPWPSRQRHRRLRQRATSHRRVRPATSTTSSAWAATAAADAWKQSHHAEAMALPNAQTVRGNFDNTQFKHQGMTTRFFRRGDRYFVHTEGLDGSMADFEIKYTFGVEPLQQYLIETDGGRLQPLQIAWNTRDEEVVPPAAEREGAAGRRAALERALPDRQHDVHRLPHDRLREALRRQGRRLRLALVGSERVLPVLPRPGLAPCRVGAAQGRGQPVATAAGPAATASRRPDARRRLRSRSVQPAIRAAPNSRPRRCRVSRTWTTTCPACCARACTTPTASSSTRSSSSARSARARCTAWA